MPIFFEVWVIFWGERRASSPQRVERGTKRRSFLTLPSRAHLPQRAARGTKRRSFLTLPSRACSPQRAARGTKRRSFLTVRNRDARLFIGEGAQV